MKILLTGAAGFIGMHVAQILLERGDEVVGIDNLNDYYDPALKLARLEQLKPYPNFRFLKVDISDRMVMEDLFEKGHFDAVINLAAQAGVRYSLKNPHAYVDTNLVGFCQRARRLPPPRRRAPRLRPVVQRLRRQHQDAVLRPRMSIIRSASTPPPRRPTS